MAGKQMIHRLGQWIRNAVHDLGLLVMRVMLGTIFVYHGSQKLFGWFDGPGLAGFTSFLNELQVPWPAYATVAVATVEFVGGIALILGLWTRLAALPLAVTMGVAIGLVHRDAFSIQRNGMEYPLTLAVCLVGLMISGSGKLAMHRFLSRWSERRASREGVLLSGARPNRTGSESDAAAKPAVRPAPQRTSPPGPAAPTSTSTTTPPVPSTTPASQPRPSMPTGTESGGLHPPMETRPVPKMIPQPPRPAAVGQSSRSRMMRIDEPE